MIHPIFWRLPASGTQSESDAWNPGSAKYPPLPPLLRPVFNPERLFDGPSPYVTDGVVSWGYVLPVLSASLAVFYCVMGIADSRRLTTYTGYFLNKYLNDGGDPSQISAFQYHGHKPVTKEQVILMVCDTVEAASRSLKDFTPEAYDKFVENMVSAKEKAGQLEEADISIREMNVMKTVLKQYLQQLYHGRVAYPKRKGA